MLTKLQLTCMTECSSRSYARYTNGVFNGCLRCFKHVNILIIVRLCFC